MVPSSVAAQAAARRLPLKRQCVRQFTDTCRVAGSPTDSRAVTPPDGMTDDGAAKCRPPSPRRGEGDRG